MEDKSTVKSRVVPPAVLAHYEGKVAGMQVRSIVFVCVHVCIHVDGVPCRVLSCRVASCIGPTTSFACVTS